MSLIWIVEAAIFHSHSPACVGPRRACDVAGLNTQLPFALVFY